jgi:hypothetical protein
VWTWPRPDAGPMNPSPITIRLELREQDDSFAGRATTASGRERDFTGWLGLMGAIDALLTEERSEEDR